MHKTIKCRNMENQLSLIVLYDIVYLYNFVEKQNIRRKKWIVTLMILKKLMI